MHLVQFSLPKIGKYKQDQVHDQNAIAKAFCQIELSFIFRQSNSIGEVDGPCYYTRRAIKSKEIYCTCVANEKQDF